MAKRKIFKYPLYSIMFKPVKILTSNCFDEPIFFALQQDIPTLWIEEPKPDHPRQYTRTFHVYGTGKEILDLYKHVASWQDGSRTWHIYEEVR